MRCHNLEGSVMLPRGWGKKEIPTLSTEFPQLSKKHEWLSLSGEAMW